MLAGHGGQRTSDATNDVAAVAFDVRQCPQLLVHQRARHRHPHRHLPGGPPSLRQLVREFLACLPQHRLQLSRRHSVCEDIDQLREQRNISARQQLLYFRRELEDMRRPRRPWPLSRAPHDAVTLHARDLRTNRAARQSETRRHLVSSQAAAA
jgi:hypothetical protein